MQNNTFPRLRQGVFTGFYSGGYNLYPRGFQPVKRPITDRNMMQNDKTNKTRKQELQLAIKQKCFECYEGDLKEVINCNDDECSLYDARSTVGFGATDEMEAAIGDFCKICIGDSKGGVRGCPTKGCFFYAFRQSRKRKADAPAN